LTSLRADIGHSAFLLTVVATVACSGRTAGPETLDHAALQAGVDSAANRLLAALRADAPELRAGVAPRAGWTMAFQPRTVEQHVLAGGRLARAVTLRPHSSRTWMFPTSTSRSTSSSGWS
jgi:hypothetical protein